MKLSSPGCSHVSSLFTNEELKTAGSWCINFCHTFLSFSIYIMSLIVIQTAGHKMASLMVMFLTTFKHQFSTNRTRNQVMFLTTFKHQFSGPEIKWQIAVCSFLFHSCQHRHDVTLPQSPSKGGAMHVHIIIHYPSKHATSNSHPTQIGSEVGPVLLAHWLASELDLFGQNMIHSSRTKLDLGTTRSRSSLKVGNL